MAKQVRSDLALQYKKEIDDALERVAKGNLEHLYNNWQDVQECNWDKLEVDKNGCNHRGCRRDEGRNAFRLVNMVRTADGKVVHDFDEIYLTFNSRGVDSVYLCINVQDLPIKQFDRHISITGKFCVNFSPSLCGLEGRDLVMNYDFFPHESFETGGDYLVYIKPKPLEKISYNDTLVGLSFL